MTKILLNRHFCLVDLLLGTVYLIGFGLLRPPQEYTISTIGLIHPWGFRLWGAVAAAVVAVNTLYLYRRFNYRNKVALWMLAIAAASIMLTVNIPTTEIFGVQMVLHWGTALFYALMILVPTLAFLLHAARKRHCRRAFNTLLVLLGLAITMCTYLVFMQNALIELTPLVGLLVILGLANFTRVYDSCLPIVSVPRRAKQTA